jgi:hypothetical protein
MERRSSAIVFWERLATLSSLSPTSSGMLFKMTTRVMLTSRSALKLSLAESPKPSFQSQMASRSSRQKLIATSKRFEASIIESQAMCGLRTRMTVK